MFEIAFIRRRAVLLAAVLIGCFVASGLAPAAAAGQKGTPAPRYTFSVQIEGLAAAVYAEVSGISIDTEVTEVREGGANDVRKVPGRTKFSNITLRRAFTGNRDLYDWAVANVSGKMPRRGVTVTIIDAKGATVAKWSFARAWPVKWQPPALNAASNDVAMETIELAHDGLSVSSGGK